MSALNASILVFACVFGSALAGMFVHRLLPDHHLNSETKDVVRLGMGLVATTLALVLGLLVASSKSFYDTQSTEVTQLAANAVLLDRVLAHYGPETADARAELRIVVNRGLATLWASEGSDKSYLQLPGQKTEIIFEKLHALTPTNDTQRSLQGQALGMAVQMGQTRWLIFEQKTVPVPRLLLLMLLFWLIVLFGSFGLFAPPNLTVIVSLFMSALAVSGAIFLILEMYHPYSGLIRVSDAPLRAALAQLGQ
jgi:hypothetical protein